MLRAILPTAILLTAAASGCVFVFSPACVYAEVDDFVLKGPSETGFSGVECTGQPGDKAPMTRLAVACPPEEPNADVFWNTLGYGGDGGVIALTILADGVPVGPPLPASGIDNTQRTETAAVWQLIVRPEEGTGGYAASIECDLNQDP